MALNHRVRGSNPFTSSKEKTKCFSLFLEKIK